MATPKEILEEEIRKLNVFVEELESDLRSPKFDVAERTAIRGQITAKTALLTVEKQRLLQFEQQGKFHQIFP
jgi:hypothetical protein